MSLNLGHITQHFPRLPLVPIKFHKFRDKILCKSCITVDLMTVSQQHALV